MSPALLLHPDGALEEHPLPGTQQEQRDLFTRLCGAETDRAVYHRQALFHVHGDGQGQGLPSNLPAWLLASAWRGLDLPNGFYGPVVVTGPAGADGPVAPLAPMLADQVRYAADTVERVTAEWETRRPVSQDADVAELLAQVRHGVPPTR
jgi:hypothetical protein